MLDPGARSTSIPRFERQWRDYGRSVGDCALARRAVLRDGSSFHRSV